MSAENTGVPVYRVYRGGTPVHFENSGTGSGTAGGTLSLKALADKYLLNEKAVQAAVQKPVHSEKKCTAQVEGSGTLLAGLPAPSHPQLAPSPTTRPLNRFEAYWYATCPDYWRGCPSCPDADLYHYDDAGKPVALNSRFCRRHPRPEWARQRMQGRLLQ